LERGDASHRKSDTTTIEDKPWLAKNQILSTTGSKSTCSRRSSS
jgi:hypothetical protein